MKKVLTAILLTVFVLPLSGGNKRVPKHEFGVGLGIGPCTWLVSSPESISDIEYDATSLSGFTGGLTYTWHFTPRWGLTTGLGIYKVDGVHIDFYGELAGLDVNESDCVLTSFRAREPDADHSGPYFIDILPFEMGIEIPLMIQFNLPVKNAFHFYTMAGFRFGILTDAGADTTCKITDTRKITYRENPYQFSDTGWTTYTGSEGIYSREKADFTKLSVAATAELGLRIPIWDVTGISVGLYGAVGLNPIFPLSEDSAIRDGKLQSLANARANPRYDEQNKKLIPAAEEHYLNLRSVSGGLRVRFMF